MHYVRGRPAQTTEEVEAEGRRVPRHAQRGSDVWRANLGHHQNGQLMLEGKAYGSVIDYDEGQAREWKSSLELGWPEPDGSEPRLPASGKDATPRDR